MAKKKQDSVRSLLGLPKGEQNPLSPSPFLSMPKRLDNESEEKAEALSPSFISKPRYNRLLRTSYECKSCGESFFTEEAEALRFLPHLVSCLDCYLKEIHFETPACYGLSYQPHHSTCNTCPLRPACSHSFLRSLDSPLWTTAAKSTLQYDKPQPIRSACFRFLRSTSRPFFVDELLLFVSLHVPKWRADPVNRKEGILHILYRQPYLYWIDKNTVQVSNFSAHAKSIRIPPYLVEEINTKWKNLDLLPKGKVPSKETLFLTKEPLEEEEEDFDLEEEL